MVSSCVTGPIFVHTVSLRHEGCCCYCHLPLSMLQMFPRWREGVSQDPTLTIDMVKVILKMLGQASPLGLAFGVEIGLIQLLRVCLM
jgi:hypothetical protein